jgi:hypothetical protein
MKLSVKVKQTKSRQMAGLKKRYRSLHKENVKVGFFEEQGNHEDPDALAGNEMSYASLMTILEKGREDESIPPRPIFETTAFQLDPATTQKPKSIITHLLKELGTKDTVAKRLDDLGTLYRNHVKAKFGNAGVKGNVKNAESTIAIKGANTPLVKEGDLRDNVAYKNSKTKRLKLG